MKADDRKGKSPLCMWLRNKSPKGPMAWLAQRPGVSAPPDGCCLEVGSKREAHFMMVSPDVSSAQKMLRIRNVAYPVEFLLLRLINQILNSQLHAME